MTRKNDPNRSSPQGLSVPEGRYLDGEMSAEEARSMERVLTANPAQAARLEAWRDAMDQWRDDTVRAGSLDPDALVDRILSGDALSGEQAGSFSNPVSPYAGRWYAAAAALLISIGIGGTLLVHSAGPHSSQMGAGAASGLPQVAGFEFGLLDKMAEGPEFAPDLVLAHADAPQNTEGR